MTLAIGNPFPLFMDRYGRPLTGGKVYVGTAGADPETSPISLFTDSALTVALPQPVDVIGGMLTNDGNPVAVFAGVTNYSIRTRDADGAEVFYLASAVLASDVFQPSDANLTALAGLALTAFGEGLLTKADGAAVRSYIGAVAPLPIAGGSMLGEIIRNGSGAYPYFADSTLTVVRFLVTANGAADPRTQNGDIWLELAA